METDNNLTRDLSECLLLDNDDRDCAYTETGRPAFYRNQEVNLLKKVCTNGLEGSANGLQRSIPRPSRSRTYVPAREHLVLTYLDIPIVQLHWLFLLTFSDHPFTARQQSLLLAERKASRCNVQYDIHNMQARFYKLPRLGFSKLLMN